MTFKKKRRTGSLIDLDEPHERMLDRKKEKYHYESAATWGILGWTAIFPRDKNHMKIMINSRHDDNGGAERRKRRLGNPSVRKEKEKKKKAKKVMGPPWLS